MKKKKQKGAGAERLAIRPVAQDDGHSCGLCAMKAVYRHYGLDSSDLEVYLGTGDTPLPYAMPFRKEAEEFILSVFPKFADLRGILPQDLMAVLHKDGFRTLAAAGFDRDAVRSSISAGHPVLVLAGWRHWTVISGIDYGGVWVADSLGGGKVYPVTDDDFRDIATGLIFLRRSRSARRKSFSSMTNTDFAREYARATRLCIGMALASGRNFALGKLSELFG